MITFRECFREFLYNFQQIKSSTDLRNNNHDPYLDGFKACLRNTGLQENYRDSIIKLSECFIDNEMIIINKQWEPYHNNHKNTFFAVSQQRGIQEVSECVYSFLKMGFAHDDPNRENEIQNLITACESDISIQRDLLQDLTPGIELSDEHSVLLLPPNFVKLILIGTILLMITFYFLTGMYIGNEITDKISILSENICEKIQCQ